MSNLYFIKAPCHQTTREQGFQLGPDEVKETYGYSIDIDKFNGSIIENGQSIKICPGYDELYNHILRHIKEHPDHKIITIGGDNSITAATIAAINESRIKSQSIPSSDLMVLYIDTFPDLSDWKTTKDLNDLTVSSLLGLCSPTLAKHKLLLKPEQFIFFGLDDDLETFDRITDLEIPFYTVNKINSIPDKVIENIKNKIGTRPLHISLDIRALDKSFTPSTIPKNNKGLDISIINILINQLKTNIISMDITEFNPKGLPDNSKHEIIQNNKTTRETIRDILMNTFDMKQKALNIFNEQSYFLIYRPTKQIDEKDYGWFILRGLTIEDKTKMLASVEDDKIISVDIEDEDYLITKTNMDEQNNKSFFTSTNFMDIVLFPEEKLEMGFELIN